MMRLTSALVVALVLGWVTTASAATQRYVIAIGVNDIPPDAVDGDSSLQELRYADDDAAAFYEFARTFAEQAAILSVLDQATQRRFPRAASDAIPPTLDALRGVVNRFQTLIARAQERGDDVDVLFFFSGHGLIDSSGGKLFLHGAALTQAVLYDQILARLSVSARYLHVFIDACHAGAVVRPRGPDLQAQIVDISAQQAETYLASKTLAKFPQVGAIIASSANGQAHEWDEYEHGVFTHQLLSGMRGLADINGDRRIEYSELHAFLAAANREVTDLRARLSTRATPPRINHRAVIVDLNQLSQSAWVSGANASLGHFFVEDQAGRRLLDGNAEPGHELAFAVPADTQLYLQTRAGTAQFRLKPGQNLAASGLPRRGSRFRARGALASALRKGLFAAPYGPHYYRGFVDREGSIGVPTEIATTRAHESDSAPRLRTAATVAFISAGTLTASTAVFGALALKARADFNATTIEREAATASHRYDRYRVGFAISGAAALTGAMLGWWLYSDRGRSDVQVTPLAPAGGAGMTVTASF